MGFTGRGMRMHNIATTIAVLISSKDIPEKQKP
jgi:hypothetical protein